MFLRGSLESLPRECATQEIHEDIGERLEVVTTSLFDPKVSVDRGITGGTRQVLVLPVGDVEVRLRVSELLCQTKVDDVDLVATFADSHEEVVGLDVTVDEVAGVDVLHTRNLRKNA